MYKIFNKKLKLTHSAEEYVDNLSHLVSFNIDFFCDNQKELEKFYKFVYDICKIYENYKE